MTQAECFFFFGSDAIYYSVYDDVKAVPPTGSKSAIKPPVLFVHGLVLSRTSISTTCLPDVFCSCCLGSSSSYTAVEGTQTAVWVVCRQVLEFRG